MIHREDKARLPRTCPHPPSKKKNLESHATWLRQTPYNVRNPIIIIIVTITIINKYNNALFSTGSEREPWSCSQNPMMTFQKNSSICGNWSTVLDMWKPLCSQNSFWPLILTATSCNANGSVSNARVNFGSRFGSK